MAVELAKGKACFEFLDEPRSVWLWLGLVLRVRLSPPPLSGSASGLELGLRAGGAEVGLPSSTSPSSGECARRLAGGELDVEGEWGRFAKDAV